MIIHADGRDTVGGIIRLRGVSIFIHGFQRRGQPGFNRRIEAAQALLTPGSWLLSQVREARVGSESIRSESLSLPSDFDARSAMESFIAPGAVPFWRLPATIRSADAAGYATSAYRLRFHQLLAVPVMLVAMSLLAAGFSLRLFRLGDLPTLAAAGVMLGFAMFFLNQFCGALGATNVIPAALAAWTPPVLALLSGVTLICYTEDG
jgi:lipopolysaccharide export system permease protein